MNRKHQYWLANIVLAAFVFFGGMVAFWIWDANSQPAETEKTCRGWHGHKVVCDD